MGERVTLSNIGGGAAVERFDDELQKVFANIFDPNTDAGAKRSITLRVTFEPNAERDRSEIKINVSSKLAAPTISTGTLLIGQTEDGAIAYDITQRQMSFDDLAKKEPKTEQTGEGPVLYELGKEVPHDRRSNRKDSLAGKD